MAAPGPVIFYRGFRFSPTPLEAATYYLPRLVAGAPLHEAVRAVVHNTDVYACKPGDLARQFVPLPRTGHRFFFTHCKLQKPQSAGKASRATRATGAGSWYTQSVTDVVDHAGVKVGEIRKLKYKKGGAYTDWLMDEYSCCLEDAVAGDRQFVLCNMYVSPRADENSVALQESAAFFAPPAPAPVVIAQAAAAAKRPAPQSTEPPCPKRMRSAVPPTPPALQLAGCTAAYAPPPPYVPYTTASAQPPCPKQMRWGSFAAMPPVVQPQGHCTSSFAPPLPYVPHIAASAQLPPPPVPTRLAAPASTPLQPRSLPQQLSPPPTLPAVRACHMPVQAPGPHCQLPQPSVQRKQRTRDPFEADEQDEDDGADLQKCMDMDGAVPTAEGETMTEEEMDRHFSSLLEEEIPDAIAAPAPAPAYKTKSSLQDDLDLFDRIVEDTLRRSSSTMAVDELAWT